MLAVAAGGAQVHPAGRTREAAVPAVRVLPARVARAGVRHVVEHHRQVVCVVWARQHGSPRAVATIIKTREANLCVDFAAVCAPVEELLARHDPSAAVALSIREGLHRGLADLRDGGLLQQLQLLVGPLACRRTSTASAVL